MAKSVTQKPQFYIPGGLDTSMQGNQIPDNASPDISNFIIEDGRMKTAPGLAKTTSSAVSASENILGVYVWRDINQDVHRVCCTRFGFYEINDSGTVTSRSDGAMWQRPGWLPGDSNDDPLWFHPATNGSEYLLIIGKAEAGMYYWPGWGNVKPLKTTFNGNDVAALRPMQSTMFWNRLFMLSPDIQEATLTQNPQMVLWSDINDIDDYDGGNAGYTVLVDTGGVNVGMRQLGCYMVVYQDNSIWNVHHVGGTTVFNPTCALTDYGLWGNRLVEAVNQVHYFVNGYDGNVYRYQGGTIRPQEVGNSIQNDLYGDLDAARAYPHRNFMTYDPSAQRIWIFVSSASGDCVKAYFLDINSGQWGVRDYSAKFTAGTSGLTCGCYDKHTDRAILLGNSAGMVYDQQAANVDDDDIAIAAYRISKEQDGGEPDMMKRYGSMAFEAKGRVANDALAVAIKVDGGSGLPSTWDTLGSTITVTTSWKKYVCNISNQGGYKIQTRIANSSGSIIEVRSIREPTFDVVRPGQ